MRIAHMTSLALVASLTIGGASNALAQGFADKDNSSRAQVIKVHDKGDKHSHNSNSRKGDNDRRSDNGNYKKKNKRHKQSDNDGVDSDTVLGILGAAAILKSID